ncbi:MAG: TfoX/Sxy family protein [Bacteroidota bacterium]
MAYNKVIADKIRDGIRLFPEEFTEKKMFGGLSFLYRNKMTLGVIKDELAVRVISDKMEVVLEKDFVRPMDFTKRPMKEFIFVSPDGFKTKEQLRAWIALGLEHAKSKL